MANPVTRFILGRTEWVALPDLGLPAIKAKVDTGARTSALHAHFIEPFGRSSAPMVRFLVQPLPARPELEIACSAPVVGRREVMSSNGEREARFVIKTTIRIGTRDWPVEVTLTNRESMTHRMLLGRQALLSDMLVEPTSSFRQGKLGPKKAYRGLPATEPVKRALRIALLTRRPEAPSTQRLAAAAIARGHELEIIDARTLALVFDGPIPGLKRDGETLPHYDAVIPRIDEHSGPFAAATVRQLELMGSFVMNPGDALDRLANPLAVAQALAARGITLPKAEITARSAATLGEPTEESGDVLRFLVVDGTAIAAAGVSRGRMRKAETGLGGRARKIAETAAGALDLGLAAIDVDADAAAPVLRAISTLPQLTKFEKVSELAAAEPIIAALEAKVQSRSRRQVETFPLTANDLDEGDAD